MTNKTNEKFDITRDEIERISEALKKEEFRKLLVEYAEEISNPENRKLYEEEIAQLESERGVDVKFVHPHSGYVLRTSVDGSKKAFINICQNDAIEKATCTRGGAARDERGLHWNIPHSFSPPREDTDKSGEKCSVYDVVFHPDTYRMAVSNALFRRAIDNTALEGIEKQFSVKFDRSNVRTMNKLKFKGKPSATVIRKAKEHFSAKELDVSDPLSRLPYPYEANASASQQPVSASVATEPIREHSINPEYSVPKYSIVNQYHVDISDFASVPGVSDSRPKALVLEINLPLLSSASCVSLDVTERQLHLESTTPARYKLDVKLPYAVNDDAGSAKFDKKRKCLIVTLPLIKPLNVRGTNNLQEACDASADGSGTKIASSSSLVMEIPLSVALGSEAVVADEETRSLSAGVASDCRLFDVEPTDARALGFCGETAEISEDGVARTCEKTRNMSVDSCVDRLHPSATEKKVAGNEATLTVESPRAVHVNTDVSSGTAVEAGEYRTAASVSSSGHTENSACGRSLEKGHHVSVTTDKAHHMTTVDYLLPEFLCDQEDTTVTLILGACNVRRESFHAEIIEAASEENSQYGGDSFSATFCTVGCGHFPVHYSLAVRFAAGCRLLRDRLDVDVSSQNAVVILHKDPVAAGPWQSLWYAKSFSSVDGKEKQFITQRSLNLELEDLETRCREARLSEQAATATVSLDVKSLHDERLSINIKELVLMTDVEELNAGATATECSPLASPEIIHSKELPHDLHGILKKNLSDRSNNVSESSDGGDDIAAATAAYAASAADGLASSDSQESPNSESDDSSARQRKKAVTFSDRVDETAYQTTAAVTTLHQTLKNKRKRQKKKDERKQIAASSAQGRRRRNSSGGSSNNTDEEIAMAAVATDKSGTGLTLQHATTTAQCAAGSGDKDSITTELNADTSSAPKGQGLCCHTGGDTSSETLAGGDNGNSQSKGRHHLQGSLMAEANKQSMVTVDSDDDETVGESVGSVPLNDGVQPSNKDSEHATKCAFTFTNSVIFELDE